MLWFGPLNQPILLAQALDSPPPVNLAHGPADKIHSQCVLEQSDQSVIAKATVAQKNISLDQLAGELSQERQFGDLEAALSQGIDGAANKTPQDHHAHHRKAGALGALDRRISHPILGCIGQSDRGAVATLDGTALEQTHSRGQFVGGFGCGA